MYYYIPHYGYCGTDNDDEFLCHYGIKGMKWKNHDYKTPEDERYWQIGYNNPVRRTVNGYIGDSLSRGIDLRIKPSKILRIKPSKIVTWDNAEKPNRRSPSEIVEDMKWKIMPTPEQLLNYRLNKESKDPFRKYMNHVRGKGLRMYLGSQTKPAVDFLKSFASAPSANERVMNRYNQMQANRRRLQGTNAPGKATAEYYKNKNGGNKFSKSSLGGTSGKISDRRLRNWVAGRAQEISNPGANPEIVNRLEADKVRRARRRRRR